MANTSDPTAHIRLVDDYTVSDSVAPLLLQINQTVDSIQ